MITANYAGRQTVQMRVLNDGQCHELYLAALECLQRIGVQVGNAEARELLAAAGADVDGELARIPAHLVQQALVTTPRTFNLWGRDGQRAINIAPDKVHFGPGLTSSFFIDPETGERRKPRRGDAAMTARVADALPNLDYVMGLGLLSDVTANLSPVYEFAEMVASTTKPILAWAYDRAGVSDIYCMAAAVAGGEDSLRHRPMFALFATYQSPLQHTDEDLDKLLWAAAHGIPVVYLGGPTVGLSSPPTGASALVLYLAMALSGMVIVQLKRPGAAMVVGCVPAPMDLRTARVAYGGPEMSLYSAAASDLSRYLGVPFMGTAGASESKMLDGQAAVESAIQVLMSALSGASLVHDIGFLDCADIGSLPLLVLTDETIAMARRITEGLEVSRETIMLDLIEQVGPGGLFVAEPAAARLCRREIWVPGLMDRDPFATWERKGGKSLEQRVLARLRSILAEHRPPALEAAVTESIAAVLTQAEERVARR
jgi:trimethylamine---corrinoid protein Co-methyltransferase